MVKKKWEKQKVTISIAEVGAESKKQKPKAAVSIAEAKTELIKRKTIAAKKTEEKKITKPEPEEETLTKKLEQVVEEEAKEELPELVVPVVTPTPILTLEEEAERTKTAAPREREVITEQQKTYSERKVGATYSSGAAAQASELREYLLETKMFGAGQLNPQTLEQLTWEQRDTLFKMAERSTGLSLEANYAELQRTVQQTFAPGRQYMQSGPTATETPRQQEDEAMRKYFGKAKT